jgi:Phage portal protein, SPP1 Gp6-like
MFDTICALVPRDTAYSDRTRTLDILNRVLTGTFYDVLPYSFNEERGASGEYIPLRSRRPSVRYPLCRRVVEDSVSLLFSEGHFPTIDCPDPGIRQALADLVKESRLNIVMTDAAIKGSIGSAAVLMRVLGGRVFFKNIDTMYLQPTWNPEAPDDLLSVTERYKVTGRILSSNGYQVDDLDQEYWFSRCWDSDSETWFLPQPTSVNTAPSVDLERTITHGLGFVPIVWIRNLPGFSVTGDPSDGACTFRAAIETQIEIDYQLSQAGRGLKYSSDPTLLIKEPATADTEIIKGAGNALIVSEKGDARLLEIGGTASAAVIEYVKLLRELALECIHGNRASPNRLTAAQSGRALEMLNQDLLWLADNLRVTYGEGALLTLLRMVIRASQRYPLTIAGSRATNLDVDAPLSLRWPDWYPASSEDRQRDASTLSMLASAGHISRETAVKTLAPTYDIEDLPGELQRIDDDLRQRKYDV